MIMFCCKCFFNRFSIFIVSLSPVSNCGSQHAVHSTQGEISFTF